MTWRVACAVAAGPTTKLDGGKLKGGGGNTAKVLDAHRTAVERICAAAGDRPVFLAGQSFGSRVNVYSTLGPCTAERGGAGGRRAAAAPPALPSDEASLVAAATSWAALRLAGRTEKRANSTAPIWAEGEGSLRLLQTPLAVCRRCCACCLCRFSARAILMSAHPRSERDSRRRSRVRVRSQADRCLPM